MIIVRVIWEGSLVERHTFPSEVTAMRYLEDRRAYMVQGEAIQIIEGERILFEHFMA